MLLKQSISNMDDKQTFHRDPELNTYSNGKVVDLNL